MVDHILQQLNPCDHQITYKERQLVYEGQQILSKRPTATALVAYHIQQARGQMHPYHHGNLLLK